MKDKKTTQEQYAASPLKRHEIGLADKTFILYQYLKLQNKETPKWDEYILRDFILWKFNSRYKPKATDEDYETAKKMIENERNKSVDSQL